LLMLGTGWKGGVGRGVSAGVDMVGRWEIVVDLKIVEYGVRFELKAQSWCECVVGRSILKLVEDLYTRWRGLFVCEMDSKVKLPGAGSFVCWTEASSTSFTF
jgi:hypothetical protein